MCEGPVEGTAAQQTTAQASHSRRGLRPAKEHGERGQQGVRMIELAYKGDKSCRLTDGLRPIRVWRWNLKSVMRAHDRPQHILFPIGQNSNQIWFVTWRGRRVGSDSPSPRRWQSRPPPPPGPTHTSQKIQRNAQHCISIIS